MNFCNTLPLDPSVSVGFSSGACEVGDVGVLLREEDGCLVFYACLQLHIRLVLAAASVNKSYRALKWAPQIL